MSEIKDGGPAYPFDLMNFQPHVREQFSGMTLRDWFAGMALTGVAALITKEGIELKDGENTIKEKHFAITAYAIADAMLKEREDKYVP